MAEPAESRVDPIQGQILHVYDGIEEADNRLPLWWLWTFYGAIVFAIGYWFYYQEFEIGPSAREAYAAALAEQAGDEVTEELLVAFAADESAVAEGNSLFGEHCAVCHKERGEGNIGPNLTDAYWIHGGAPVAIHTTISEGVLSSGMPAWGATLGPRSVQQLTAFVLSIQDTNVPGKEPEGEPMGAGGAGEDEAASETDSAREAEGASENEAADAVPEAEARGDAELEAAEAEAASETGGAGNAEGFAEAEAGGAAAPEAEARRAPPAPPNEG